MEDHPHEVRHPHPLHPQPWGHPTSDYLDVHRDRPAAEREQADREFGALLEELRANGELVGGEALADPAAATLYRWDGDRQIVSAGPYAETTEHFAGFFLLDVADRARAEDVARRFSGPGETVELRPAMWPGGEDG